MGWEKAVRPFIILESPLANDKPAPVVVPLEEAEQEWGKASRFQYSVSNPTQDQQGPELTLKLVLKQGSGNKDEPPPEDPTDLLLDFREILANRKETMVTVTDKSNPEFKVDLARGDLFEFDSPGDFVTICTKALGVQFGRVVVRLTFDRSKENQS